MSRRRGSRDRDSRSNREKERDREHERERRRKGLPEIRKQYLSGNEITHPIRLRHTKKFVLPLTNPLYPRITHCPLPIWLSIFVSILTECKTNREKLQFHRKHNKNIQISRSKGGCRFA